MLSFPTDTSGNNGGSSAVSLTLKEHFERAFGPGYGFVHARAVQNFVRSLVGYSLVTYLLQVRGSGCVRSLFHILLEVECFILDETCVHATLRPYKPSLWLQVKDRHNANILIDSDGHIIHIDYGFILGGACGARCYVGFDTTLK